MKNVKVTDKESKMYTSNDINSAIETIKKEFQKDWKGCTLKEIYYAGDDISKITKIGQIEMMQMK